MPRETESTAANFDMGECFCDVRCVHGHATRMLNIGREHYVACDSCRTCVHVGSNLTSAWRQENRAVWGANRQSVKGYEKVRW